MCPGRWGLSTLSIDVNIAHSPIEKPYSATRTGVIVYSSSRMGPIAVLAALALALTACGGATSSTTTSGVVDSHDAEQSFGEPADPSEATRTIDVDANDDFTFNPSEIKVSAGEIVTLRVKNTGVIPHDFTLGDQATQDEHEAEMMEAMEGGGTMHDEDNAVVLAAGETKEITWHFADAGSVLIGCHQPGHYASGMTGSVTIDS